MSNKKLILKGLTTTLCALFVVTNCVLAYASESNFWKERKKHFQAASLPQHHQPFTHLPQLPTLTKTIPSAISNNRINKWLREEKQNEKLKEILRSLPASCGSVRDVSIPKNGLSNKIVIHIHDVHMNMEAQKNIGAAVQELINKAQVDLVALEGAFDAIDLSVYRNFPQQDTIHKVADYLLRENKISGPVHTAFVSPSKIPQFIGVDDKTHYQANVKAVKDSYLLKEISRKKIAQLNREIENRKKESFNKNLMAYDQWVQAYHKGSIEMGDYVEHLSRYEENLSITVQAFLEALEIEKSLNFKQVEQERTILLSQLMKKLNQKSVVELMDTSLSFRTGEIDHAEFYQYLKNLCQKNTVDLNKFKEMSRYLKYVLLADSIQAEKLIQELRATEAFIYRQLTKNKKEDDIVKRSRNITLLSKLIDFSLTKDEWDDYRNLDSLVSEVGPINQFEKFYREAEIRDSKISENLLSQLKDKNIAVSILVTGGFHSKGILRKLKRRGISVINWVPKLTKVNTDRGSAYLSVFTQNKSPLDKVFSGEKLFLANLVHPPKGATDSVVAMANLPNSTAQKTYRELQVDVPEPLEIYQISQNSWVAQLGTNLWSILFGEKATIAEIHVNEKRAIEYYESLRSKNLIRSFYQIMPNLTIGYTLWHVLMARIRSIHSSYMIQIRPLIQSSIHFQTYFPLKRFGIFPIYFCASI